MGLIHGAKSDFLASKVDTPRTAIYSILISNPFLEIEQLQCCAWTFKNEFAHIYPYNSA